MRIEQLTFTRFIAAISIVIFHFGKNTFPFNSRLLYPLFNQANIGVSYFFILSGFVLVVAYHRNKKLDFGVFVKRRLGRIYPVYLLSTMLLISFFLITKQEINGIEVFLNLTFLQSWAPGYSLSFNTPAWSLSAEFFFYLIFPLLMNKLYKNYSLKFLLILVSILFLINQTIFYSLNGNEAFDWVNFFPLMRLNEFMIGNVTGLFFIGRKTRGNFDYVVIFLTIIMIILLKLNPDLNLQNGLSSIIFVPFIYFLSINTGRITTIFQRKIFVFLGEISYGVYILQSPVFHFNQGLMNTLKIKNPEFTLYFGTAMLIIFAAISYRFLETPIRKWVNEMQFSYNRITS